jgi:hypothetical protein
MTLVGGILATMFSIGRRTASIEQSTKDVQTDVAELKGDVKKVGDIVTQLAVTSARMDMFDKRLDDIVHGRIRLFAQRKDNP